MRGRATAMATEGVVPIAIRKMADFILSADKFQRPFRSVKNGIAVGARGLAAFGTMALTDWTDFTVDLKGYSATIATPAHAGILPTRCNLGNRTDTKRPKKTPEIMTISGAIFIR